MSKVILSVALIVILAVCYGYVLQTVAQEPRLEATKKLLFAKKLKGFTFEEIAKYLERSEVWVAALFFGQVKCTRDEAEMIARMLSLDIGGDIIAALQEVPTKGSVFQKVPTDPLLYRFYEILQVYGPAIKSVIHEKFGDDGIMSAVDFKAYVEKEETKQETRVKLILNGKWLPYKPW
jgi:cyanate lyase